jgi:hypothetical protein
MCNLCNKIHGKHLYRFMFRCFVLIINNLMIGNAFDHQHDRVIRRVNFKLSTTGSLVR